jgi:hypothetical protein
VGLDEDSDGNGIYNSFQIDWGWEGCDPTTSECPCETFVRDTNPVCGGSGEVIDSNLGNSCERYRYGLPAWDCYVKRGGFTSRCPLGGVRSGEGSVSSTALTRRALIVNVSIS